MVDIQVGGNVQGSIVVGDNNVVVNHNHGTIVQQAALPTQRRNLSPAPPRKPIGFVGRKLELQQLENWISSSNPIVVQGLDGIGKTSLVKQAANSEAAKSQPDGVLFLEEKLPLNDLTQRMFEMLFESQPPELMRPTLAREYLSTTRPLVLLNSIPLSEDDMDALLDLFPNAPILIATESSDVSENYQSISLGPLAQSDSLDLLAGRTKVEDRETLGEIASLLDNVPAALIVVANVISKKGKTANDVLSHLRSYEPDEKDKARAALDRAFELIVSTLTQDERGMLLQAAASPGISTERKWLDSVSGGNTVSEKLEELNLLQANSPRLRLMPGLRPFLLREQDISMERERLLSHLVAELQTRWNDFEFIKDELGNLLGLLAWAVAEGQWMHVVELGRGLDPYLTLRGLWDSWRKTLGEIQEAAGSLQDLALQGWVSHQLGTYEIGMGNLSAARNLLEQAVKIRTQLGDQVGAAYSQHNLQVIAPVAPPVARPANLIPWALGGLAVIAIAAFLIFGNLSRNPAPPTVEPTIVAVSEVPVVASPSSTPTATRTLTETPTATINATFTSSPTGTPTATPTPTYAIQNKIVVNELADVVGVAGCFHGPGTVYLSKGTLRHHPNNVDLLGRIETDTGIWVLNKFSLPRTDGGDPCWMDAKYLDITEAELMSVAPFDPTDPHKYLPLGVYYPDKSLSSWPTIESVIRRDANTVVVSWSFYDVTEPDRESPTSARYLIEAWVCKAGKIVFQPIGVFFPTEGPYNPTASINITDETGCSEPSHARLYLSWIDAYAGPVEISPWPQSETVLPTPTP